MTRITDDNTCKTFAQHLFQLISEKAII